MKSKKNIRVSNDNGMSLRDYFAGQALSASGLERTGEDDVLVARRCYQRADAMLKVRVTASRAKLPPT